MAHADMEQLKDAIVQVAHLLHQRGYIGGMDGNISVRVGSRLLCTPSGVNKGFMNRKEIITTDLEGKVLVGSGKPSSELAMHLEVYKQRQDVGAVVHAHPPHCVACTLTGIDMTRLVVPELAYTMGAVPTAPYATPGTREVPDSIAAHVGTSQAILLERHGSITFGSTLQEAYDRLEGLEHAAHILFLARNLGTLKPLSDEQVERLRHSVEARGLPWMYTSQGDEQVVDRIVEQVLERLRGRG